MARRAWGRSFAPNYSIKSIWGIAKSKELNYNDDELYSLIIELTGKSSMKALTQNERNIVYNELEKKKNMVTQKRTDTNGNSNTMEQRRKIYALTEELGWNNNNARINGFVKRMFKVDRVEWLDEFQCSKLIEILKGMIARQKLESKE